MNTLACEKNSRIFSVVSFPLILCFMSVYITVIRDAHENDTVPLHPTVYHRLNYPRVPENFFANYARNIRLNE